MFPLATTRPQSRLKRSWEPLRSIAPLNVDAVGQRGNLPEHIWAVVPAKRARLDRARASRDRVIHGRRECTNRFDYWIPALARRAKPGSLGRNDMQRCCAMKRSPVVGAKCDSPAGTRGEGRVGRGLQAPVARAERHRSSKSADAGSNPAWSSTRSVVPWSRSSKDEHRFPTSEDARSIRVAVSNMES